jgi:hypothetical protein
MTINWDCKKQGCYKQKTLPDWAMLNGCFGATRVSACDVDGLVYQNSRCLFLEKKFPAGFINEPQMRQITSLVYQGNSYIVFWCEQPDGSDISSMRVFGVDGYHCNARTASNLKGLRDAVKTWWSSVYEKGKI